MYRFNNTEVPAIRLCDGSNTAEVDLLHEWGDKHGFTEWEGSAEGVYIDALGIDGVLVEPGDWIVKMAEGVFVPFTNDIFEKVFAQIA